MENYLKKEKWSPYLVGMMIGITFLIGFIFFNKTIGTSTSFVKAAAWLHQFFDDGAISKTSYYQDYLKDLSWVDWQVALVIGVFLGAFCSNKFSTNSKMECISKASLSVKSKFLSFLGGVLVIFGARFAGGCTSGHVISGGIQLATSGYLFMAGVFLIGIPAAFITQKLFSKEYL